MDTFSGRSSRPAQPAQSTAPRATEPEQPAPSRGGGAHHQPAQPKKSKGKKIALAVVAALVAVALVFAAVTAYNKFAGSPVDSAKYQAVFLTNGQVYFGKLQKSVDNYYKLTDVFYLQATQTAATENSETESQNPQDPAGETGVQLIKLGNEVHGPEDEMIIDRSQVLFIENLKDDGKVVDSIKKYKTENQ